MTWHLKHALHGDKPWAVQAAALERVAGGRPRYGWHLEQGLGKTSLTFNEFVGSETDIQLVLAPNSFKGDWPLVPQEWGVPEITSGMWPRDPIPYDAEKAVYAVNYEAARSGALKPLLELMDRRRVFLTIDESSAIKGFRSLTTRSVIELSKRATMVRELNGTPLVQDCMDTYGPLRTLGELNKVNPFAFRNRYAKLGGYMGRQIVGMNNEAEFYALLDSCSFRALKKDWRDLPEKIYTPVHLEMTNRQRRHYSEMLEEFFTQVGDLDVSADMVLIQLDKLRQIASCLAIQDGKSKFFEEPEKNPKLRSALDIIDGGPGKAIVVHYYKATGAMLVDAFYRAGLRPARIAGGMKPEDVAFEKKRFNEDPECRILVGQESATARGHTLLGGPGNDRCSRMIFFEQSFSLMERLQIEDRIHRGEQDQACLYYDLLTSSIDQKVVDILQRKKSMADAVDEIIAVARSELK